MIHLYWDEAPPLTVTTNARRWATLNNGEATVWTPVTVDHELIAAAQASATDVYRPDRVRHVANIVRWWLLATQGGVWADADVMPRRRLPTWLINAARPWCAALEGQLCPFMCGGPPGHPLWRATLKAALDHPRGTSPGASGGGLLARVAGRQVTGVPARWFATHDATGAPLLGEDAGLYCTHEWTTSRRRRDRLGAHVTGLASPIGDP